MLLSQSSMLKRLRRSPKIRYSQAARGLGDDVWTFVATSLAPDIVHWRFGTARERYLGGVRNTFQRLWMRGRVLDRGADHHERWQLLEKLTEDALVQITERPSLGGDPVLARAIAEAWLRASLRYGGGAMEPIMRRAALRVRIRNEIRSLADLPSERLTGVLNEAFDLEGPREDGSNGADSQTASSQKPMADLNHSVSLAAMRVLGMAKERGWISPKSSKALNVLQQGERKLTSREQKALDYLLRRMRSAALLHEEVSRLSSAVASNASPSEDREAEGPPSSTRKRSSAIVRAR